MDLAEKRKRMNNALKKIVVPEINNLGFSGSFPHFRKKNGEELSFVSFQFGQGHSSLVGSFVVEFGCIKAQDLASWAKSLPFEKLGYGNTNLRSRLKSDLYTKNDNEHTWFDYSNFSSEKEYENLATHVKSLLPEGLVFIQKS